ncbi:MAG TPA: hypothetical protein DIT64_03340 [Verrucomicrobiales bacterium]|nr:hypothetical protein [Verrucomicrobiales bacterium]HCN79467.1 hypothetical protein [Verrucomicrobiales bacterium]HRJ08556.1 hypothetical protein [Prosthecobacter sp.]HRK15779.1 hypothetical protein [Prosthecobacter sp.]
MNTPENDPLDDLLLEWQVRGETPASQQREVWARIAAGEAEPAWWESFLLLMLRPRSLALTAAAAVVLGVLSALLEMRAPEISPHDAYVQCVSPFASVHLASH